MPTACRRLRRHWAGIASLCFAAGIGTPLHAQTTVPAPEDLTALNLEELSELNISSAAKRTEPVFDTSSAVSVISSGDMLRYGLDTVADGLRLVPGVLVENDSAFRWTVGVRGFDGLTSNKLLVLVDGLSVYSPFYGAADWTEANLPLDLLDHIEVVRGPGATLWGANAMNGIINIISKSARDTQGGLVSVRQDSTLGSQFDARYGWTVGDHTWVRVSADAVDTEDANIPPPAGETQDFFREWAAGFRVDSEPNDELKLMLEGSIEQLHHYAFESNPAPGQPAETGDIHAPMDVLGRLIWDGGTGNVLTVQLYVYGHPDSATPGAFSGPGSLPLGVVDRGNSEDLDFSDRIQLGARQDFLWGGGIRRNLVDLADYNPQVLQIGEPMSKQVLANLFAQDEIALVPDQLRLTVGAKAERDPYIPTQFLPSVRLTWMPSQDTTLWLAASRAVRTPFVLEHDAKITFELLPAEGPYPPIMLALVGSPLFHQEDLTAYEAGWRWRTGTRFSVDVSAYLNRYSGLRDFAPVETLHPTFLEYDYYALNLASATGYGAEASAIWRVSADWHIVATYTAESIDASASVLPEFTQPDYAEPKQMASLRSSVDLPKDWQMSVLGAAVGRLIEAGEPDVPGYFRLDAQVSWRPTATLEVATGVQNALQGEHEEAPIEATYTPVEIPRNFFVRSAWRF